MGTEYGQSWRIEFGTGGGSETFIPIAGETSFDWNRQSKEIDEGTKDDEGLTAGGYGNSSISFAVSGKLKLPDAGIARVSAVSKLLPPKATMRVVRGEVVKYEGQVAVGNFSTSHPNDETCTWKFDAKACAVPTKDDLGATA